AAAAIGIGNPWQALAGSFLLRRVARLDPRLERIHDVISLVLLGAICSTAISAAVGVASLWLGGTIVPALSWPTFRAWWLGDMLGDLVVAPLLFVWLSRPRLARRRFMAAEAVAVAASLVGCSLLVFGARDEGGLLRQSYVIFPLLLWAALRFAQYGAVNGRFLVWPSASLGPGWGLGPSSGNRTRETRLDVKPSLSAPALPACRP